MNYLIDPTFDKVNRLFVLSFENGKDRTPFSTYYIPSVAIKDLNVLIAGKGFFDVPIKKESYEKNQRRIIWEGWVQIMITQLVI